ncbi:15290_t:CDS:2, partial [Cetraspora pellucida]
AIFLVRRNDLRIQLNFEATIKHTRYHNQPTYFVCAKDTYHDKSLCGILSKIVYDDTSLLVENTNNNGKNIIIDKPPKYIIIGLLNCAPDRIQLPVTPAFALTEFKCQGATIKKAIVNLNGSNIRSGIYVMLSRVQRLQDIMILQPFNQSKLNVAIEPNLKNELERLEKCSETTND